MTLYIAQCVAFPCGQNIPHVATLVGRAPTLKILEEHTKTLLQAGGHTLLGLENITEAQTYLRAHGETELITAMITSTTEDAPVRLASFFPVEDTQSIQPGDPVLLVERHATPPLVPDNDQPFWNSPWCPPELASLLFDEHKRTYAVIDAAKRTHLLGYFDMDILEDAVDATCLFAGQAAQDLAEIAPYLIDITPFGEQDAVIPPPLRDLFSVQWPGGAYVIIRVDAELDRLRKHLRRFMRIRSSDDADAWTIFRFWDPVTASTYFPGIAHRPERVDRIFRDGSNLPLEIFTPDLPSNANETLRMFPRDDKGVNMGQDAIVFDADDHALMQEVADRTFRSETALWLKKDYPERFESFDVAQMDAAVTHIMTEGKRLDCDLKDDYAYLAHMMLTLGGWFAHAEHPRELTNILADGQGNLRSRLSRSFLGAYEASPQAALMNAWDEIVPFMSEMPENVQIIPAEFNAFLQRFLRDQTAAVEAALAKTKQDLSKLELPMAAQGRLLILTLMFGHRFYEDPLRDWSQQTVAEVIDTVWAATLI